MIEPSIEPTNNIDDINAENLVSENTELISDETPVEKTEAVDNSETPQSSEILAEEKMIEVTNIDVPIESTDIEEIEELDEPSSMPSFDNDFTNYTKK
jgi:hypothetical protein